MDFIRKIFIDFIRKFGIVKLKLYMIKDKAKFISKKYIPHEYKIYMSHIVEDCNCMFVKIWRQTVS